MIVDLESSVWLICSYVIMKVRFHTPIQQNSKSLKRLGKKKKYSFDYVVQSVGFKPGSSKVMK